MEPLRTIRESVALRRGLGLLWHLVGIALCYYGAFLRLVGRLGPDSTTESLSDELQAAAERLHDDGLVRESVDGYFAQLDGHDTTGLYDLVVAEVEAPLLESVLDRAGGNQTKAAEILGINRGTLRKKLRHYKLI